MPNNAIKIATLSDLESGSTIDKKAKSLVEDKFKNLKSTIAENSEVSENVKVTPTKHFQSFVNFATNKEARELNLAKQNITGLKKDASKWLKTWMFRTRWSQLMRQRNYSVIQLGLVALTIDVVQLDDGTPFIRLEQGRIVSDYLDILYGKDYQENYLLIETDPITAPNGTEYRGFKEYDRPAGVVRYWCINKNDELSKSVKRVPLSEVQEGSNDVWNYKAELGIDFLPLALTWNDSFGNPTLKYQTGMIMNLSEFVDDILPNWISTRSNYNVNELYMRASADAAAAYAKQISSKKRVRKTKTNSNKYISEVSILEGDPKTDALFTSYNALRAVILEEAELDIPKDERGKQKNDTENSREQRDPKKMLTDKSIIRGIDDTILFDRVLTIATKLGLVKNYQFCSIKVDYDIGFVISEKEQMALFAEMKQQNPASQKTSGSDESQNTKEPKKEA